MNERMKLKIEREIWPQCISNVTTDTDKVMKNYFDKYKFAELIVAECSQISRDHQRNYYESHGDRIAKKIKEHFGVE
jgi:hypothetical protein